MPRNGLSTKPASTVLTGAIEALQARESELMLSLGGGRRCYALRHHLLIVRQRLLTLQRWTEGPRPPHWRAYVQDALDLIGKHTL